MRLLEQRERDSLTLFLRGEASPPRQLIEELRSGIPALYEELAIICKAVSILEIEEAHREVIEEIRK